MQDILVLGAGKIGALISGLLAESGDYRVQLVDEAEGAADEVTTAHDLPGIQAFTFDAADSDSLRAHVRKHRPLAVISGLPFFCNIGVAEIARSENLHYFDLTEDVEVTKAVRNLAGGAEREPAPGSARRSPLWRNRCLTGCPWEGFRTTPGCRNRPGCPGPSG